MPRLDLNDLNNQGGWSIPWKLLGVLSLFACIGTYAVYQYERFYPKQVAKIPAGATALAATNKTVKREMLMAAFTKVGVTPEQRVKLEAIDKESTNTKGKMQLAAKVLTHPQRVKLRDMRAEQRKLALATAERKRAKYFPNGSAETAKAANKAIREAAEARRKAAQDQKPTEQSPGGKS